MRRMILAAALLPPLAAPALAQSASSDPTATGFAGSPAAGPASTGVIANPGQLSTGGGGSAGVSGAATAGVSTPMTNPGQLDFSRTAGTGGATSGGGAGIATGSAGTSQADDTYLYPLYGKSLR